MFHGFQTSNIFPQYYPQPFSHFPMQQNSQQTFHPFMLMPYQFYPTFQVQAPIQAPPPQIDKDRTQPIQVNGTKIWLNLKIIKELPTEQKTIQESKLNPETIEKLFAISRKSKTISRRISTRNVQIENEVQPQYIFRKNNGKICIGKKHQAEIIKRPFNHNLMRMKLKAFQIWNKKNQKQYNTIKEVLQVSDDKVLQVLQSFTNHNVLQNQLLDRNPLAVQEILLKIKQQL